MKEHAISFHVFQTLPALSEGSATLALLARAGVAPNLQDRLGRHLLALHQASAGAYEHPTDRAKLQNLQGAVEADILEARPLVDAPTATRERAAAPGMHSLDHGPHESDPQIMLYLRVLAPGIQRAVEVARALQTQGKTEEWEPIYLRLAGIFTIVRRIFQGARLTQEQQIQAKSEIAALARTVNSAVASAKGQESA